MDFLRIVKFWDRELFLLSPSTYLLVSATNVAAMSTGKGMGLILNTYVHFSGAGAS